MSLRALLLALALAAPADASAAPATRAGLTVWPARVRLAAGATAAVHVANGTGRARLLNVDVAGFALDFRGVPRVVGSSAGTRLLRARPRQVVIPAHGSVSLNVQALGTVRGEPGDHPALLLLTARSGGGAGLGVRVRIGVTVEVRVPGVVRHRLDILSLRVARGHVVDAVVADRGNVAERVARGALVLRVWRSGRIVGALAPRPRELLPRTRGIVEFVVPRRIRGRVRLVATAPRAGGARRTSVVTL